MNRKQADFKELEQIYAKNGNQLIVLYGRKDCRKEELLHEFVQDKKCFYYRCRQASSEEQKRMMSEEIEAKLIQAIEECKKAQGFVKEATK